MMDLTPKPLAGKKGLIEHYNVMGPVKAALESAPGPVKTRAASGIDNFDDLLELAAERAPAKRLVSIEDVGVATAVLATDYTKRITGGTVHVDGGYHILG